MIAVARYPRCPKAYREVTKLLLQHGADMRLVGERKRQKGLVPQIPIKSETDKPESETETAIEDRARAGYSTQKVSDLEGIENIVAPVPAERPGIGAVSSASGAASHARMNIASEQHQIKMNTALSSASTEKKKPPRGCSPLARRERSTSAKAAGRKRGTALRVLSFLKRKMLCRKGMASQEEPAETTGTSDAGPSQQEPHKMVLLNPTSAATPSHAGSPPQGKPAEAANCIALSTSSSMPPVAIAGSPCVDAAGEHEGSAENCLTGEDSSATVRSVNRSVRSSSAPVHSSGLNSRPAPGVLDSTSSLGIKTRQFPWQVFWSPLDEAVSQNNRALVELLVNQGAEMEELDEAQQAGAKRKPQDENIDSPSPAGRMAHKNALNSTISTNSPASSVGTRSTVRRRRASAAAKRWEKRLASLADSMAVLPDFYLELDYRLELAPWNNRFFSVNLSHLDLGPSDTVKVYKQGRKLRIDSTLASYKKKRPSFFEPRIKRRKLTTLFIPQMNVAQHGPDSAALSPNEMKNIDSAEDVVVERFERDKDKESWEPLPPRSQHDQALSPRKAELLLINHTKKSFSFADDTNLSQAERKVIVEELMASDVFSWELDLPTDTPDSLSKAPSTEELHFHPQTQFVNSFPCRRLELNIDSVLHLRQKGQSNWIRGQMFETYFHEPLPMGKALPEVVASSMLHSSKPRSIDGESQIDKDNPELHCFDEGTYEAELHEILNDDSWTSEEWETYSEVDLSNSLGDPSVFALKKPGGDFATFEPIDEEEVVLDFDSYNNNLEDEDELLPRYAAALDIDTASSITGTAFLSPVAKRDEQVYGEDNFSANDLLHASPNDFSLLSEQPSVFSTVSRANSLAKPGGDTGEFAKRPRNFATKRRPSRGIGAERLSAAPHDQVAGGGTISARDGFSAKTASRSHFKDSSGARNYSRGRVSQSQLPHKASEDSGNKNAPTHQRSQFDKVGSSTRRIHVDLWLTDRLPFLMKDLEPILQLITERHRTFRKIGEFWKSCSQRQQFSLLSTASTTSSTTVHGEEREQAVKKPLFPIKIAVPFNFAIRACMEVKKYTPYNDSAARARRDCGQDTEEFWTLPADYTLAARHQSSKIGQRKKKRSLFTNFYL
ncbi:unnamed protein product [Amoebophrya sp. A120]|nr:unnamed protein product [Amoebophrya sp. A120]|eukprot:GSA120T00016664001.1